MRTAAEAVANRPELPTPRPWRSYSGKQPTNQSGGRQIGVNVKPFRKGSFIVDLALFSPSHIQQLLDFQTPHSLEQLNSLLSSIGIVGTGIGTTTMGAVGVIKFLRGKPKAVEELKGGEVRYTSQDDKSITVNGSVHSIQQSNRNKRYFFKVYVTPMQDQPSIDDVKTYLKGHEESAIVVGRNDIDSIRDFSAPTRGSNSERGN